jgi:hypothetical protein
VHAGVGEGVSKLSSRGSAIGRLAPAALAVASLLGSLGCHIVRLPPYTVLATGQPGPNDLCADKAHLYWEVTPPNARVGARTSSIMTVPKAGGPTRKLYETPAEIAIDHMAADEDGIYFVRRELKPPYPETVMRLPRGSASPVEVAATKGAVGVLEVDATNVYWSDGAAVYVAPKAGGAPRALLGTSISGATGVQFHVSGGNVYVMRGDVPTLEIIPTAGGAGRTVALKRNDGRVPGLTHMLVANDVVFSGPPSAPAMEVLNLSTGLISLKCVGSQPFGLVGNRLYFRSSERGIGWVTPNDTYLPPVVGYPSHELAGQITSAAIIDDRWAYVLSTSTGTILRQALPAPD